MTDPNPNDPTNDPLEAASDGNPYPNVPREVQKEIRARIDAMFPLLSPQTFAERVLLHARPSLTPPTHVKRHDASSTARTVEICVGDLPNMLRPALGLSDYRVLDSHAFELRNNRRLDAFIERVNKIIDASIATDNARAAGPVRRFVIGIKTPDGSKVSPSMQEMYKIAEGAPTQGSMWDILPYSENNPQGLDSFRLVFDRDLLEQMARPGPAAAPRRSASHGPGQSVHRER
jgi:hypothetical protein